MCVIHFSVATKFMHGCVERLHLDSNFAVIQGSMRNLLVVLFFPLYGIIMIFFLLPYCKKMV